MAGGRRAGSGRKGGITPRERLFAHLYVLGQGKGRKGRHNATEAARGAGYTDGPGLPSTACRVLKKAKVAELVRELEAEALQNIDSKRDQVLAELHHLGFARLSRVQNDDGSLKPLSEWPEAEKAALTKLQVKEKYGKPVVTDDGAVVPQLAARNVTAELGSKLGALTVLAEHHEIIRKKGEGEVTIRLEDLIMAARKRLELKKLDGGGEGGGSL